MRILLIKFLLCCCYGFTAAQADSSTLLGEVKVQLADQSANVSSFLSDSKYKVLHGVSSFRQMIKQYAAATPLTIVSTEEPGDRIKVTSTVRNEKGKPIAGVLIYIYQTDARGWYMADSIQGQGIGGNMQRSRLFGYVKTDKKGYFELNTIKPASYPDTDVPSRIHIHLSAEGYGSYVTELLFEDDKRITPEISANVKHNRYHISKAVKSDVPGQQEFSYTLVLRED